MRSLAPLAVSLFGLACATLSAQACSSDDPIAAEPDATETPVDATADATDAPPPPPPDSSTPEDRTLPGKPTDGGLDVDARGPDEYVLQVDSCEPLAACGGNLTTQRFRYTGGCFDQAALQASLRDFASCDVVVSNSRGLVKGTFEFQAEQRYTRELSVRVSGDVFLPADCNPVRLLGCAGITAQAAAIFPGLQCYETADESCDCLFSATTNEVLTGTYSKPDANTLQLQFGDADAARLAPYCYEPGEVGTLTHTERDAEEGGNGPGNFGSFITWNLTEQ